MKSLIDKLEELIKLCPFCKLEHPAYEPCAIAKKRIEIEYAHDEYIDHEIKLEKEKDL